MELNLREYIEDGTHLREFLATEEGQEEVMKAIDEATGENGYIDSKQLGSIICCSVVYLSHDVYLDEYEVTSAEHDAESASQHIDSMEVAHLRAVS